MSRKTSNRITHKMSCRANIEDWNTILEIQQELAEELGISDVYQHDVLARLCRHYRATHSAPKPAPAATLPMPQASVAADPSPTWVTCSIPGPVFSCLDQPQSMSFMNLNQPNFINIASPAWNRAVPAIDFIGGNFTEKIVVECKYGSFNR